MSRLGYIASCGVQACLLEVGAEKPGNVSPTEGFTDTSYGDFVCGSRALRPVLLESAVRGFKAGRGELAVGDVGIGLLVKKAVLAVKKSHKGGNTHLGVAMLLVPLVAAAGLCPASRGGFLGLRGCVRKILLGTTVRDSLDLYDGINLACAGGLGKSRLDVKDSRSKIKLKKMDMSLIKLMRYFSRRDRIASELSLAMPVVFNFVVPNLKKNSKKTKNLNKTIVQTYLQTLAKYPDTLISRKLGTKKSREVSKMARKVLKAGGVFTKKGMEKIQEFDSYLRSEENKLNPGTTADLTTAGLFIHLLQK